MISSESEDEANGNKINSNINSIILHINFLNRFLKKKKRWTENFPIRNRRKNKTTLKLLVNKRTKT